MKPLFFYVLPLMLTLGVFALPRLREWVEHCAKEASFQPSLVEQYQTQVAKFLKASDPDRHAEMREMIVWAGDRMLDGSVLIQGLLISHERRNGADPLSVETEGPDDTAFEDLSEEAKHAFASALGTALLVSSYQSPRKGHLYREMLKWVLSGKSREVREPQQIVYRYRRATHIPVGEKSTA